MISTHFWLRSLVILVVTLFDWNQIISFPSADNYHVHTIFCDSCRQSTTFQLREATLLDQISSMHQQLGELQCTSQHKDTHINSGDQHSSHVPTEIPDAHVDMASSGSSGAKADSNGAKLPKGIDHSRTRRLSGLVDRADWQVRWRVFQQRARTPFTAMYEQKLMWDTQDI